MIYFPPQNELDYSILHASRNRIYRGHNKYIQLYNKHQIPTDIHKRLEQTSLKSVPDNRDTNNILSEIQDIQKQRENKLLKQALQIQHRRLLRLKIKILREKRKKHTPNNDLFNDNTTNNNTENILNEAYKSINLTLKSRNKYTKIARKT